ncbi:glycerophosphoryl diester phosphodiesterase [Formivibrio citricus]|uniref:Glycerophosphoryl diester phosphodiesterase n=1 Tax=Formivibrio citricus TaxID=83765 RepID=A0A1I4XGY9_9NEIS|nr:glycerophosphodiester phosphodiesterase [Formivibrio citricus]SFN24539.1 glycerophosphoryl diester phosphodiesterase [Formivibrio citricus]
MRPIAHRGFSRIAPENTLAAFACALAAGFSSLHTDVRLSADGELVLYSPRVTPEGHPVAALSRSELSLSAGYLVPTLVEALDAFPDAFWNIEIKTPSAAPFFMELAQNMSLDSGKILLSSFRHEIIVQVAELLNIECGLLAAHRPPALNTLLYAAMPHPRLRTLIWHYEALDITLLEQANALGFHNWAYGAETDYEHQLCQEFGIQGIITDYPEFFGLSVSSGLQ